MIGQVADWTAWVGLRVLVAVDPSPPPNWPTIRSDVGTLLELANVRLFVRLTVRSCPVGTVITTGDQVAGVVAVAADAGFSAAQVVGATAAALQL
jgi:hypothetical protein